jgi:hypothetical protein
MNQALLSITSVRTETATVSSGLDLSAVPGLPTDEGFGYADGPQARYSISVEEGERLYTHDLAVPPGSCTELAESCLLQILQTCRPTDACKTDDPFAETLRANGTIYHRSAQYGAWMDETSSCGDGDVCLHHTLTVSGTVDGFDCTAAPSQTPLAPLAYQVLVMGGSVERLADDDVEGKALIHLRGIVPNVLDRKALPGCEMPSAIPTTPVATDDLTAWVAGARISWATDVWVDSLTFRAVRSLEESAIYHGEQVLQRDLTLSLYSDYNTATIPGPLPTR